MRDHSPTPRAPLIAVTGIDGSGKSTAARLVAQRLSQTFAVEAVERWDIVDRTLHPNCAFIDMPLSELRRCVAEMEGPARTLFLFWTFSTAAQRKLAASTAFAVLDGYWMKHGAAEVVYGNSEDWIASLAQSLPVPARTYFIDVDPEQALNRKSSLLPYECGMSTPSAETFVRHQSSLRAVLVRWARERGWHRVAGDQPADDVASTICEDLLRLQAAERAP